jgi:hypothetical protein
MALISYIGLFIERTLKYFLSLADLVLLFFKDTINSILNRFSQIIIFILGLFHFEVLFRKIIQLSK